jgi:hypothetical protein
LQLWFAVLARRIENPPDGIANQHPGQYSSIVAENTPVHAGEQSAQGIAQVMPELTMLSYIPRRYHSSIVGIAAHVSEGPLRDTVGGGRVDAATMM